MSLSYSGLAPNANPPTYPTHAVGDLLVHVWMGYVTPSTPTNWTGVASGQFGTTGIFYNVVKKIATTTTDGNDAAPNGVAGVGHIYPGGRTVGVVTANGANSASVGFPAATLNDLASWVMRYAFVNQACDVNTGTISGYTNRYTAFNQETSKDTNGAAGANPGAVSQGISVTNNWGALTIEIQPAPSGTIGVTLKKISLSVSGTQAGGGATGTIGVTLRKVALSAAATQKQSGTIGVTLKKISLSLAAQQRQSGTVAITLKHPTITAAGAQTQSGTIGVTLRKVALSAAATQTQSGTIGVTLKKISLALSGAQTQGGTIGVTLKKISLSLAAQQRQSGTVAITLKTVSLTLTGSVAVPGIVGIVVIVLKRTVSAVQVIVPVIRPTTPPRIAGDYPMLPIGFSKIDSYQSAGSATSFNKISGPK